MPALPWKECSTQDQVSDFSSLGPSTSRGLAATSSSTAPSPSCHSHREKYLMRSSKLKIAFPVLSDFFPLEAPIRLSNRHSECPPQARTRPGLRGPRRSWMHAPELCANARYACELLRFRLTPTFLRKCSLKKVIMLSTQLS